MLKNYPQKDYEHNLKFSSILCLACTRGNALFIPEEIIGIDCCLYIYQSLEIAIKITISINFTFLVGPIFADANVKVPIVQISTSWVLGHEASRPDHGLVRTAGSNRNRGKKIGIGIENSVSKPKSDPEPIKI